MLTSGGVFFGLKFSLHGGEGIEEQLRDVGQGDGVAAGDAFASELFDEVGEEMVHRIGGGELFDPVEKLGGDEIGIGSATTCLAQPDMTETETAAGLQDAQAAASAVYGVMTAA